MQRAEPRQSSRGIAVEERLEEVEQASAVGEAEHGTHARLGDLARAHGDRLVEHGEAVAHRALGRAGDQGQRLVLGGGAFVDDDALEVGRQQGHIDTPQIEALAAREHGNRHLADLGRRENELDVRRGLLERLQKGIERALREHVDLVDDENLVAGHHRLVARALDDLAHVVDAGVGRGVHLDHVGVAALDDLAAVAPGRVQIDRRARGAVGRGVVERASQDAGGRRLADAADAREHVGLGDSLGGERVAQRRHHGVLADQVVERLRPVLAGQDDVACRGGRLRGPEQTRAARIRIGVVRVAHPDTRASHCTWGGRHRRRAEVRERSARRKRPHRRRP